MRAGLILGALRHSGAVRHAVRIDLRNRRRMRCDLNEQAKADQDQRQGSEILHPARIE